MENNQKLFWVSEGDVSEATETNLDRWIAGEVKENQEILVLAENKEHASLIATLYDRGEVGIDNRMYKGQTIAVVACDKEDIIVVFGTKRLANEDEVIANVVLMTYSHSYALKTKRAGNDLKIASLRDFEAREEEEKRYKALAYEQLEKFFERELDLEYSSARGVLDVITDRTENFKLYAKEQESDFPDLCLVLHDNDDERFLKALSSAIVKIADKSQKTQERALVLGYYECLRSLGHDIEFASAALCRDLVS